MHKLAVVALLTGAAIFASISAATAQSMPSPQVREVMIKSTLMTFNDANLTDNYDILNSLYAQAFAERFTADKLSEAFEPFRDQSIDLSAVVAFSPVEDPAPVVDADGILQLKGYFETDPSYVAYDISFVGEDDGVWRMTAINVHVAPPADLGITPKH